MKTKCVRLYGQNDLRLGTVELPEIKDDEILVKVISDSICMSSYKAAMQGSNHKRVPDDIAENPVIIGHEFCGEIVKVGSRWAGSVQGRRKVRHPARHRLLRHPAHSRLRLPLHGRRHPVRGDHPRGHGTELSSARTAQTSSSTAPCPSPSSCIIGTFHAQYHTKLGCYTHEMGIVEGGNMAILAGAGPMGLGAIDYAIHCDRKPGMLVVTDIDQARLDRAASIYTVEDAAANGVKLVYLNTSGEDPVGKLMALTDNKGYNDVLVFAPVAPRHRAGR